MLRNIEISLLRSFATLASTGSFTRSAELLFRTQSAITMQMQKLDELLGCKLTYRSGKSINLTAEGRMLLPYALEIIRLNDELQASFSALKHREQIRIGTSDDYAVILLPRIIHAFRATHPDVELTVHCSNRNQNLEKFKQGELDFLLTPVTAEENIGETLRTDRLVWIGSPGIKITESEPVPLTGFPLGCVCRDLMIRILTKSNRKWKFVYSSNSIVSIHSAIMSGQVVSAVEESTVPNGVNIIDGQFGLPPLPEVKISAIYKNDKKNKALQRFCQHVSEGIRAGTASHAVEVRSLGFASG
ncbi:MULTISPECIES: LysR family transcriptional regulator [unclassified Bradyrhizobium]|uniref:LysR family transcriptional regulator n=1 Tax=Bradyrhizobium TaxID=374 RepID=UPI0023429A8A|nr:MULTISPECIES: LysR family transcriptional regulator [unclassified Bradyrhizobium]GLH80071.1 LysR family transcriptional regulator [Bradyrhizobium sp. SSBR45G]GLH87620.1 LysR family transcriptional regulator [Bradyrhizobium sp. SSBR45R]